MPTTAMVAGGTIWVVLTSASALPKNLPTSAPRNSEAKNNPPRNPEPIEIAEAQRLHQHQQPEPPDGSGS